VIALLLLVVGVVAYNTSPANPAQFGHSIDEVDGLLASLGGTIPVGAIMAFNLTACPQGWTRFAELDGRVVKGSPTLGILGGSDTHSHTHQDSFATNLNGGSWRTAISTLTIDANSTWPPFLTLLYCMKTSANGGSGGISSTPTPTVPSGTWCGMGATHVEVISSSSFSPIPCQGIDITINNCPTGYTKTRTGLIIYRSPTDSGDAPDHQVTCVKN
jgi:hypothetical protein